MIHSGSEAIYVEDLEKRFGRFVAVDRITFSVKRGEIFGFWVQTVRKIDHHTYALRIITPTSGYGRVAGHDIFSRLRKSSIP